MGKGDKKKFGKWGLVCKSYLVLGTRFCKYFKVLRGKETISYITLKSARHINQLLSHFCRLIFFICFLTSFFICLWHKNESWKVFGQGDANRNNFTLSAYCNLSFVYLCLKHFHGSNPRKANFFQVCVHHGSSYNVFMRYQVYRKLTVNTILWE